MTNREKLQKLIEDVFLLDSSEFSFELMRSAVETWDSFGVVSLAVGIQQTFGPHLTAEEANGIKGVDDIINVLTGKGISFE
jgi:acyl carrier protein